jgi:hypothetical protein
MGRTTSVGVTAPDRSRPDDRGGSARRAASQASILSPLRGGRWLPARNRSSSGRSGSSRPGAGESRTGSRAAPEAARLSSKRLWRRRGKRVEQRCRLGCDAREFGRGTGLPQPYDEIERIDRRTAPANRFAQHALEAITVHGASEKFLADHVSDAARRAGGRDGQELQAAPFEAATAAEHRGKCRGTAQPMAVGQTERARRAALDGEPGTAFGTPCAQNSAAADGLHPGAEPMGPLPPDYGGLVSALHGSALPGKKALY